MLFRLWTWFLGDRTSYENGRPLYAMR